ncbi:MAG: Smr/MutS family protein [Cyclobacteriaceae bacterium]|nr:Smr/MutS family protein [Cyclobacteriaceae bacterium]
MIYPIDFENKIGFDQIRTKLKLYCLSSLGTANVDAIEFSSDFHIVQRWLLECDEFKQLFVKGEPFPASHYFDPTELYPTISVEESFIEEESFRLLLLSFQTILEAADFLERNRESYPSLFQLSSDVKLSKQLVLTIQSKFDEDGHLRDQASPDLARIRRSLREEEGKVRRLTEQLFRQASSQGWVPEGASPTIREGRLVIPILAEHKRKLRGLILDESATGQTIYMEPSEVLEANNDIRDLFFAERREIIKVLKALTTLLRQHLSEIQNAYVFLGQIDLIRAKAKLALELDADLPELNANPTLLWTQARHPLLFLSLKGKKKVVPLDIELTDQDPFLLVSGPNAGGKSVCLKTVGLIQYMCQCGLLVPMYNRSRMGIFKNIFIDIGDQQSMENVLSTYSSHLRNMGYFLNSSNHHTLVLLDELGSGTDPNFGGGIAEAILFGLVDKKVWGVATTHYYNLKLFAEKRVGVRNGSMRFDTKQLEPLFTLEIGKPGSSFALEIARKSKLPDTVLQRAEQLIGGELIGLETLMKSVAEEKQQLEKRQREFQFNEKKLAQELQRYQVLSTELELKKKEILNKAKTEATYLLKETNREIEKTIRHIQENKAEKKETRKVRAGLTELAAKVQPENKAVKLATDVTLKVGDRVRMIGQEVTGTLLSIKGNATVVQFGNLQSHLKLSQLVRSDWADASQSAKRARSFGINVLEKQSTFESTLDVRGKRVEEVGAILDQFLDDAMLLGQGELKILHGKGEGVLRKVVREQLKKTKQVASFKDEHVDRGGDGITVVVLK